MNHFLTRATDCRLKCSNVRLLFKQNLLIAFDVEVLTPFNPASKFKESSAETDLIYDLIFVEQNGSDGKSKL
jgi:hypothetical protein